MPWTAAQRPASLEPNGPSCGPSPLGLEQEPALPRPAREAAVAQRPVLARAPQHAVRAQRWAAEVAQRLVLAQAPQHALRAQRRAAEVAGPPRLAQGSPGSES